MLRVLLHTLVFPPDGVSTSALLADLMEDLAAAGHQITILTTSPHYNRDEDAEAKQPLTRHVGGFYYTSEYCGMRVIHTYMRRKGQGVSGRMRDYVIFHTLSLLIGLLLIGRHHVVLCPSPPLSIGVIGWLLARLKGAKFIYNVQELYPALALQMGLTTPNSRTYKLMSWLERFVYARADHISVICEPFRKHVLQVGAAPTKVTTIPNFVDVDFIQPSPKDNRLTRAYNLTDKFVIKYAGNIGMTQSFDTILATAQQLQDEPNIHFLIVGDGARRQYVEEQITRLELRNVTLLPYQPRSEVPFIYAAADISLVPLMKGTAHTTIPSKIYSIMASGRPVLVAVDEDSDIVRLVQQAQCGLAVPPDDADALEQAIRYAYTHQIKLKQMGLNGRQFVEAHFSRAATSIQYDKLLRAVSRGIDAKTATP